MRVDGNYGGALSYEPNSYGEWQEQPDFSEPPLAINGDAHNFDFREDDHDYYSQPGNLFVALLTCSRLRPGVPTTKGAMSRVRPQARLRVRPRRRLSCRRDRQGHRRPTAPAILSRADAIQETYRHPVTYFKSAFGLTLLRDDILGPQRFDFAFRKFIADWAFKHPSPSDFFRAMESEGGEDLSYFWRGWYFNNWQLDLAITDAKYIEGDSTKGLRVTIANRGQLVLPAALRVTLTDGSHVDLAIPAETWMQQSSHTFTIATSARATSVTIDPDHKLPDSDRSNNTLPIRP
jgi:hypothetical protein